MTTVEPTTRDLAVELFATLESIIAVDPELVRIATEANPAGFRAAHGMDAAQYIAGMERLQETIRGLRLQLMH